MTQGARRAVVTLYVATAGLVTLQRGVADSPHTTFRIFRQSFWHLLAGRNLYAAYPAEQGAAPADLFKYSPTAALLYAPFAIPPYGVALFAWSLLGALLLYHALTRLLSPRDALLAAILVYPDLLASMQGCSSNALVAALIVLAFVAMERGEQVRGAAAVVLGAAIKIFPLSAIVFALFHRRRRRLAIIAGGVGLAALLLPLLVVSPEQLVAQYRWWVGIERYDAADLGFGLSLMRVARGWIGGSWPDWPVQLAGTGLLLAPFVRGHHEWHDERFRLHALASVLVYAVLFNHQAERSSFVIASTGVAIWCVSPPSGARQSALRVGLSLLALVGLETIPLVAVWVAMQVELHRWTPTPAPTPSPEPVPAPFTDAGSRWRGAVPVSSWTSP